jgi:hypothetical protein
MTLLRICVFLVLSGLTASAEVEPLNAMQAAERVIIPKVHFQEATLREAVDFIGMVSRKHAKDAKRLNVIVAIPPKPRPSISLQREGATMAAILKECAEQVGCEVQGEPHALVIREKGAPPLPAVAKGKEGKDVGLRAIQTKLDAIIFPRVDFREATVREAIEFVVQKSKQVDPDGAGVSIVLKLDDQGPAGPPPPAEKAIPGIPGLPADGAAPIQLPATRISLQASHIPMLELLRYVAGLADLQVTVEKFAIVITAQKR